MDNENDNPFGIKDVFPNAEALFTHSLQPVEKIKKDCFVVLDTNVLLFPYSTGKTTLDQISKIYQALIAQKRLVIPGQVAREFSKNRGNKISELFQQISRKSSHAGGFKNETYPLLESLNEYKEVLRLEDEINKTLAKYRHALGELLEQVILWQWNDPVTKLYRDLFSKRVVLDIEQNGNEIQKDLIRRFQQKIPPGYKDAAKPDSGVGDLLIWYTILSIGEKHKKSVIFVSGDEKSDWQIRSEGQALYPRYELIDEFRQKSNGASFYILSFSKFLDLFGVSESVVAEIREKEMVPSENYSWASSEPTPSVFNAFYHWIVVNYPDQTVKVGGDDVAFEIIYDDGSKMGVLLTTYAPRTESSLQQWATISSRMVKAKKYKYVIVASIIQGANDRKLVLNLLANHKTSAKLLPLRSHIAFLVGHMEAGQRFTVDHFE